MKLEFLGHDERYIVEQSLMTLFPLEITGGEWEARDGVLTGCYRGNGGGLSGHSGAALSRIHRRRDLCIPPHRHGL